MNLDDDFGFGANVWGSTDPEPSSATEPAKPAEPTPGAPMDDDDFDDADFAEPVSQADGQVFGDDDDDFGDFGDEQPLESAGFAQDTSFVEAQQTSVQQSAWEPLRLDPLPSRHELEEQIHHIIAPIFPHDLSSVLTDDSIREAEGINQVLVTPESRDLFNMLIKSPPPTKPPNWIRSKIRRQQLITMGIPVNLDEVLPTTNSKPLPPLQISTRPMSAPPSQPASASQSRSGTPQPGRRSTMPALGPKPELDHAKINRLLELDTDSLTISPLPTLEQYLADLRSQTANTSALLTYLLQVRDALQQDSETYNGLIAELVGEAQKMKTGKKPQSRRGSGVPT